MSQYLYVVVLRDKYPSASFYSKKDAEAFGMDMSALRLNGEKL